MWAASRNPKVIKFSILSYHIVFFFLSSSVLCRSLWVKSTAQWIASACQGSCLKVFARIGYVLPFAKQQESLLRL